MSQPAVPDDRNDSAPNSAIEFDPRVLESVRIERSAVERRAATFASRRVLDSERRIEWLRFAVSSIDLTALSDGETPDTVRRLCADARNPIRRDVLDRLGAAERELTVAAVCVQHAFIATALDALRGSDIRVAAVSAGFPSGAGSLEERVAEIEASVAAGAREIDVVVARRHALAGDWRVLYDELRAFRGAARSVALKTILSTGELGTLENVARASFVAMQAGADFIKTSTGKEAVNATLPAGLVMLRAIRDFHEATGRRVGFKAAGGIRSAKQALEWSVLVKEELGDEWLTPRLFRLGASALIVDLERELESAAFDRATGARMNEEPPMRENPKSSR